MDEDAPEGLPLVGEIGPKDVGTIVSKLKLAMALFNSGDKVGALGS